MTNPSAETTKTCAQFWIKYGYGENWDEDSLQYDPTGCSIQNGIYHLRDIRNMKQHLEKDCPKAKRDVNICDRAIEIMNSCERHVLGLSYQYMEFTGNYASVLKKALSGEVITASELQIPSYLGDGVIPDEQLRIIRNAIFARHGRPFTSSDLQDFFYGADAPERFKGMPIPPQNKSNYSDDLLTENDRANIQTILNIK